MKVNVQRIHFISIEYSQYRWPWIDKSGLAKGKTSAEHILRHSPPLIKPLHQTILGIWWKAALQQQRSLVSRMYISPSTVAAMGLGKSQHTQTNATTCMIMAPQKRPSLESLYNNKTKKNRQGTPSSRLIWAAVRSLVSRVVHWHLHHQGLQLNTGRGSRSALRSWPHIQEARSGGMGSFVANNQTHRFAWQLQRKKKNMKQMLIYMKACFIYWYASKPYMA